MAICTCVCVVALATWYLEQIGAMDGDEERKEDAPPPPPPTLHPFMLSIPFSSQMVLGDARPDIKNENGRKRRRRGDVR